jgi:hypothetical protein
LAGHDLRGRARVFDFNVDGQFPFSESDAMVFEIVPPSSLGALAAIRQRASKRWLISKRCGLRSRTNPFGG